MSEASRCERCGGPLPAGALDGRCPRCLLELELATATPPDDLQSALTISPESDSESGDAARLPISNIGRYRIVRLIGEGGMGAVYEAEQDQPRRTVALKVIKPGLAALHKKSFVPPLRG